MALEITIDGNQFGTLDGLYEEMISKLVAEKDHGIKHNIESMIDVLEGGFGVHEYDDPIKLIWENSNKSKEDLKETPKPGGPSVFEMITKIIGEQDNVELVLE